MTHARATMILHDIVKYGIQAHTKEGYFMITSGRRVQDTGFPQYGGHSGSWIAYTIWPHELQEAVRVGLGEQQVPLWRYEQPSLPFM